MTIYIDDSGTSPENAVAVAAGWIAHTDSWVDFQADWDKMRDIDGDKFDSMHMAEFVFGRKGTEFEGWSLEKKQRISARLRGIIKKTVAKGYRAGRASSNSVSNWSGRADLNRGPPAPKAGGLL